MSDPTPHYLLNALAGWRAASPDNAVLAQVGKVLSLQALPGSERPLVDAAGSLGGLQAAVGVAVDSRDRVYILDAQACVLKRFDPCMQQFVTLPCIGGTGGNPRQFSAPHGLAVSCADDIYVADTGNCRVQIFSAKGLALRGIWGPFKVSLTAAGITVAPAIPTRVMPFAGSNCQAQMNWPPGIWQPWDIVVSQRHWAYVSDYANGLIHVFDPQGCWRTAYTGAGATSPPLVKPTRLALDRAGRIYVVQENQNCVVVLAANGEFVSKVHQPDEIKGRFCPIAVAVDVNGNLCLSDCVTRRIYFYQPDGDGGWRPFKCCGSTSAFAASLLYDRSGNPLYADGAQRVCQLTLPAAYQKAGTYYSEALDSKTYRCVWHRVWLAGSVPSGTSVTVDTLTAESMKSIDEITSLPQSRWATNQTDTDTTCANWDCMIQSPPGRYLWLRLTFSGNGTATPVIEKMKIYYPRASSLQYLPAVYRADPVSSDFLDRFLSIFDTIRGKTSDQVTTIARYFDPKATPAGKKNSGTPDFLSWLASWLGMSLQHNWSVAKRRELVRQAHRLYALRGTPKGLRLHLELYAGLKPRILEQFRLRRWLFLNNSKLGDCTTVYGDAVMNRLQVGVNSRIGSFQLVDYGDPRLDLFNAYAHRFLVVVPRWPGAGESDRQALLQIIEMAKPAHTIGTLEWAEPRMRVGIQGFIGVDTVIGKYPLGVIEGQGKLGYDTVLGTPGESQTPRPLRIGGDTRLGCNTILN
jgi:phage tail-like protein